ncbi:hypothetical protein LCGC14_1507170 [marine sediment metagenome]|uniref:Uncharacterized protein n=1 Tax=marine sediment metagenome TaxID=412755 RepID=A0A0F9JN82_9ZZZZ
MYNLLTRNAPAISILIWVFVLTLLTALGNCASAQDISQAQGEINGQWYRSTISADTLVVTFNKYGTLRLFFIIHPDYEGSTEGLGPKMVTFAYGAKGYILLRDSMCGPEAVGWYHATIVSGWMFLANLQDTCEARRLFFTGSWRRAVKEIQQPVFRSDALRGKELERIYY